MTLVKSEAELANVAAALLGPNPTLTPAEAQLIEKPKRGVLTLKALRAALADGQDPLGDAFLSLRTAERRRGVGAVYTPHAVVAGMVKHAAELFENGAPTRIIDPGSGSGRYLVAAATEFPNAELVASDIDPLAMLVCRANLRAVGAIERLRAFVGDYALLQLPETAGASLFIGNPPYVRHHDLSKGAKDWYAARCAKYGYKASKLAGLHLHFFLKSRDLAKRGDVGVFITAAEWLDVNYGAPLRGMLANGLGGTHLSIIDPKARPFADALATAVITSFAVGSDPASVKIQTIDSIDTLPPLSGGKAIKWRDAEKSEKWTALLQKPARAASADVMQLGDLFRVQRGQVTGANAVFIRGDETPKLPASVLKPAVTKAAELIAAGPVLETSKGLRRVVELPVDLDELSDSNRKLVDAFLRWARKSGGHESYIATHRKAWWSVGLKAPAPILVTYMARRPPTFVRNAAKVFHLNIAHGLYPREPLSEAQLDLIAALLRGERGDAPQGQGRTYAGGLLKFEPSEIERATLSRSAVERALAAA